jgi:hypothetical protein
MEGMTPEYTFYSQKKPLKYTVLFYRLIGIDRTAGGITAASRKKG